MEKEQPKKKHKKKKDKEEDLSEEDNLESRNKMIYGDRFEVMSKKLLGKGSFGWIYLCHDLFYNDKLVAIKIELDSQKRSKLSLEKAILETMSGVEGFPEVYAYGQKDGKNFMAMENLGPNLHNIYDYCNRNFSLKTVCLIGIQAVTRIENLHNKGYLHRDIKPENFTIGVEENTSRIYLIDFGLSKKFKDQKNEHIPYLENKCLTGTARWASINNHFGIEQSRRDDLESLAYILVYFLSGSLPWQGHNASNKVLKYKKIMTSKMSIPIEVLCKELPSEFCRFLNYIKSLKFNEKPDYDFLRELFFRVLAINFPNEYEFDFEWNRIEDENEDHNFLKPKSKMTTEFVNRFGENEGSCEVNDVTEGDITESVDDSERGNSDNQVFSAIENFYNKL